MLSKGGEELFDKQESGKGIEKEWLMQMQQTYIEARK